MISKEISQKVKRIKIQANRLVNAQVAGQYVSAYKGHGMVFSEVTPYSAGDDFRHIDWNVSARMGELFIKQFVEERELRVILLIDMSQSGFFGTQERDKRTLMAEIAAVIALAAIKNGDTVGVIIFTDIIEHYIPPKKGIQHVMRIISDILSFQPKNSGTNISHALEYLNTVHKKQSVAFLISDFFSSQSFENALKLTFSKHDLTAIMVNDPIEITLPQCGVVALIDTENNDTILVNFSDPLMKREFEQKMKQRKDEQKKIFRRMKMPYLEIDTKSDYLIHLVRFFKAKTKSRQYGAHL